MSTASVSNGLKFLGRFLVGFHPKPDRGTGSLPHEKPGPLGIGQFYHQLPSI